MDQRRTRERVNMETISKENINSFLDALKPSALSVNSGSIAEKALAIDLPTTRNEKWKYTRLAKIKRGQFKTPTVNAIDSLEGFRILDCPTIVFVNGIYNSSLSSIDGTEAEVNIYSEDFQLADNNISESDPFQATNTAYLNGGAEIIVKKGKVMNSPLQVLFISSENDVLSNIRLTVKAEENAQGELLIGSFGMNNQGAFTNVITSIHVAKNAHLKINKLQFDSEENLSINQEIVHQDRDSVFTINTFTLNGLLVRNNLTVSVDGENCESNLYGAYILKGNQHVDNHTVIDQRMPNCLSNELYKGVMDEKSTAVFNGKVFVRKDAQKVNAFQSNGNVLLSDDATVNSKPELEIYADDVKCSHGSTTGQLDEEAVFYLRSRGISENSARQLLVTAFIEDTFENVGNDEIIAFIHSLIKDRFGWQI